MIAISRAMAHQFRAAAREVCVNGRASWAPDSDVVIRQILWQSDTHRPLP